MQEKKVFVRFMQSIQHLKTGESANSASKGVNELNDGMKRSMVGSLLANTGVTLLNGAF